jgi:AbrB family looped-hinge helix DNA binding protein
MSSNSERMSAVIADASTVSDKIRALDRAGYKRGEIARFLGKRYQHVRNVLVADQQTRRVTTTTAAAQSKPEGDPSSKKMRVGPEGQVVIPQTIRATLGLKEGDVLIPIVESGELHLLPLQAAVRRAQAIVRRFVPEGVSLVDELLEDRRREAEREAQDG